ncbi:MAG: hypothetical protein LBR51_01820 [Bacteroidales bacterium]|jgi:hypothetical protein|nr:hypothetical protein [Bacteroidales bacterium]
MGYINSYCKKIVSLYFTLKKISEYVKKEKSTTPKPLSPENYIRQRSRGLPIYECWITDNWEIVGLANIVITRRHVSGNITACLYLVDLTCMGVKDTYYFFNISEQEYREFLGKFSEHVFVSADYNLVHNIIFAAKEFAAEYGFKPHKDFTTLTEYFLEEDDDHVPLMEIHCGEEDGKPLYVNTGSESKSRENQILKQLKTTAGEENFHYITSDNNSNFDEDEDEDDDDDFDDDFVDDDFVDDDGENISLSQKYTKQYAHVDTETLKNELLKALPPKTKTAIIRQ